jgi:2'-5' RNA ligase
MARLFLAVWPDPDAGAALARCRDAWAWPPGARPVADERLHLTLHFIGSFPVESIAALDEALAEVPMPATRLRAQGFELWRGGIAVLRLDDDPVLTALHAALAAVLTGRGVALDSRPFAPHVTLARKAGGAARPSAAVDLDWRVSGFVLVESITGANAAYRVLRRYADAARGG